MRAITRARARVFGGINFGDLVKNSPIRQIKISAKVSGYTVFLNWLLSLNLTLCFRFVGWVWPGFTHTRTETSTTQVGEYRTWTLSLYFHIISHSSPIFWWWWSSEGDAQGAAAGLQLHHHLEEHSGSSEESWYWTISTGRPAGSKILSQWVH